MSTLYYYNYSVNYLDPDFDGIEVEEDHSSDENIPAPQWTKQQRPLDPDHNFCVFLQDKIPSDASYGECGTCKACFHFPDLNQYFNRNSTHKCPVCREDWSVWTEYREEAHVTQQ